jgi:DNA-binding response OmpR family regulator
MATVLCTGVQLALMHTRKIILENAGHTVITAQSEAEIVAACRKFRFDVTVIGQATHAKLNRDWLTVVRRHCPSVKVLEVYMTSAGRALEDADDWLESPVIPATLAERVSALAAGNGRVTS